MSRQPFEVGVSMQRTNLETPLWALVVSSGFNSHEALLRYDYTPEDLGRAICAAISILALAAQEKP